MCEVVRVIEILVVDDVSVVEFIWLQCLVVVDHK